MQQRLTRGIQYDDVARAADALLQEGRRPTIERIRLHIGRGSPNTVSPMLEQWFSELGKRLGGVGSGQNHLSMPGQGAEVPEKVLQMAQALWQKAATEAQLQSELLCAEERANLELQALQLQQAQTQLHAKEMALNERLKALENALQSCQQQLSDSQAHWQTSLRTLSARDAEIAAARSALEQAREQLDSLQRSLQAQQQQMLEERSTLEERHHAAQQRWLVEVDRARQETRKSALQAEQNALQRGALQQALDTLRSEQHAQQLEQTLLANTLRNELSAALHAAEQSRLLVEKLQQQAKKETLELQQPRHKALAAPQDPGGTTTHPKMRHTYLGSLQRSAVPRARRNLKKRLR